MYGDKLELGGLQGGRKRRGGRVRARGDRVAALDAEDAAVDAGGAADGEAGGPEERVVGDEGDERGGWGGVGCGGVVGRGVEEARGRRTRAKGERRTADHDRAGNRRRVFLSGTLLLRLRFPTTAEDGVGPDAGAVAALIGATEVWARCSEKGRRRRVVGFGTFWRCRRL